MPGPWSGQLHVDLCGGVGEWKEDGTVAEGEEEATMAERQERKRGGDDGGEGEEEERGERTGQERGRGLDKVWT